jgi:hypothetical protein
MQNGKLCNPLPSIRPGRLGPGEVAGGIVSSVTLRDFLHFNYLSLGKQRELIKEKADLAKMTPTKSHLSPLWESNECRLKAGISIISPPPPSAGCKSPRLNRFSRRRLRRLPFPRKWSEVGRKSPEGPGSHQRERYSCFRPHPP